MKIILIIVAIAIVLLLCSDLISVFISFLRHQRVLREEAEIRLRETHERAVARARAKAAARQAEEKSDEVQ